MFWNGEAWAPERQAITLSFTLTKQIKLMNLSQFVPYCTHLVCQTHWRECNYFLNYVVIAMSFFYILIFLDTGNWPKDSSGSSSKLWVCPSASGDQHQNTFILIGEINAVFWDSKMHIYTHINTHFARDWIALTCDLCGLSSDAVSESPSL